MAQNQAHTYIDEQVQLLSSTDGLTIKKVRGKYVISTMPTYKFFGIPGTLLECQDCMDDATWRGVLIGACQDCQQKYSGEGILIGFDEKVEADAMPGYSNAAPFGFYSGFAFDVCFKINELLAAENIAVPLGKPRALETDDAYSFYGLSSLSNEEFCILLDTPTAYNLFADRYYAPTAIVRFASIDVINKLRTTFDPFSKTFYTKCKKMETEWTKLNALEEKEREKEKEHLHPCHYCGDIKETGKCAQCQSVRYCSVACQNRDWSQGGAYDCHGGKVSSPHKEVCEYLMGLRLRQEQYENGLLEEGEEKTNYVEEDDPEYGLYNGLM